MIPVHAHAYSTAAPCAAEGRAALQRIAASRQFRASPQLVAFLRYVVEQTLAGHSAKIKSYTIAVEALDRDSSFDPQTDAIVRVEAGRLRRALAHYYAGDGRDDPVVIELPRGSYVPQFRRQGAAGASPGEDGAPLAAVFERLSGLRRQLDAMAAEIESAKSLLRRTDRPPEPRD